MRTDYRARGMSTQKLTKMCQNILTDADIKTIIKHRNFTKEANSRAVFQTFFLSNTGLQEVFASLTKREISLLHLLKRRNEEVDISFFEALYGAKKHNYGTFTQQHTPIFKEVQQKLLRKGLLIISTGHGTTKMEQWRFELPQEFAALLPPLITGSLTYEGAGESGSQWLRKQLIAITNPTQNPQLFSLQQGHLCWDNKVFSYSKFTTWNRKQWLKLLWKPDKLFTEPVYSEPLLDLLDYALDTMAPNQWFKAQELTSLLKLYFHPRAAPNVQELCKNGWQCGFLIRHRHQDNDYYKVPSQPKVAPDAYMSIDTNGNAILDLQQVPFTMLEILATIARFTVADKQSLLMEPDIMQLGEAEDKILEHPICLWLQKQAQSFQQAFQTLDKKRGKQLLHDNLYIAKVTDLNLRVQIQKYFSNKSANLQVIMLNEAYIAFPRDHIHQVQKLVTKAGFAIKTLPQ